MKNAALLLIARFYDWRGLTRKATFLRDVVAYRRGVH